MGVIVDQHGFRVEDRDPTRKELRIGEGIPSGVDGQWRVLTVAQTELPLHVLLSTDGILWQVTRIASVAEWNALPDEGIQMLTRGRAIISGHDEYILTGGESKYGIYLLNITDEEFDSQRRTAMEAADLIDRIRGYLEVTTEFIASTTILYQPLVGGV